VSQASPELLHLQRQLHELRAALAGDDDARAAVLVHEHDRDLRQYVGQHGTAARDALSALLALQGTAMAEMRVRRDAAAAALRNDRRANHAARAYVRAGAL